MVLKTLNKKQRKTLTSLEDINIWLKIAITTTAIGYLCFGFKRALIEFARNVLGLKDTNSTEIEVDTENPVIDILPDQKKIEGLGGNMRLGGKDVEIKKGTKAYEIYGKKKANRKI
jgi:CTP synthase (UTP-ammonia lyase)